MDNIQKAKVQMLLEQPFFASLALRFEYYADTSIETTSTNGKYIRCNPDYIDSLNSNELKTVLAHDVMHVALLHHTRRANREPGLWNEACDYAINPLLVAAGFRLPQNALISSVFKNMSAEKIYSLLAGSKGAQQGNKKLNPGAGLGSVEDLPPSENVPQTEAATRQAIALAAMIARQKGALTQGLEALVTEVLNPKVDWSVALASFVAEVSRNDYSWAQPSQNYIHLGLYLPSLKNLETGNLIMIVDTSKSIDEHLLNQTAAEVTAITSMFNIPLLIIYVDIAVQSVQEIELGEPVVLKPKGRGGTSFKPGFEYIGENNLDAAAVIYMTDGICDDFPDSPSYPVLWAQFGEAAFTPPFGEVIQIL